MVNPQLCRGDSQGLTFAGLERSLLIVHCSEPMTGDRAMSECQSLAHATRERKYRVVFIPKCWRKVLCKELGRYLGPGLSG